MRIKLLKSLTHARKSPLVKHAAHTNKAFLRSFKTGTITVSKFFRVTLIRVLGKPGGWICLIFGVSFGETSKSGKSRMGTSRLEREIGKSVQPRLDKCTKYVRVGVVSLNTLVTPSHNPLRKFQKSGIALAYGIRKWIFSSNQFVLEF